MLAAPNLSAQNMDLKWSQKMQYDNFKDGFFKEFVGSSDQLVFGIYNNLALRPKKANKQIKLIAFDKKTMRKVGEVPLKNKKDKARSEKLKDFRYHSTVVVKDHIYVFWEKTAKNSTEIHAEVFDLQLDRTEKLKKVYKATSNAVKNATSPSVVVRAPKNDAEDILVGAEIPQGKGENVDFDYVVLGQELEEITKGRVTLPVVQVSRYAGSAASYEYDAEGNIYIKNFVRMSRSQAKKAQKGEYYAYSVLNIVDISTGEMSEYTMKYQGINIFNFNLVSNANGVKIYGFFNDMQKDPSGLRTHGLFHTTIKNGEMSEPNFSYFDKKTLDDLFKNDQEDKKKTYGGKKKREKAKPMDDEALDESYTIEVAQSLDSDNIVLFCSKMYNYSVTTCTQNSNGGQSCTTRYYCRKSNVTGFRLNNKGDIVWASNIDRLITYSGTSIYDLRVVAENNKFYVIYGSAFAVDAQTKNRKSAKKGKEIRDNFEYAVFDYESGKSKKQQVVVNQPGTAKKERKTVSPTDIQVIDNRFYINSDRITMKPGLTVAGCAASVVCFPVLYYVFLSGDFRKGTGYLGTINITK